MEISFLSVPLWLWGLICLTISTVLGFFDPGERATNATGWRLFILRCFHSIVWLLLAIACFVRWFGILGGELPANIIAFLAIPTYIVYVFTLVTTK